MKKISGCPILRAASRFLLPWKTFAFPKFVRRIKVQPLDHPEFSKANPEKLVYSEAYNAKKRDYPDVSDFQLYLSAPSFHNCFNLIDNFASINIPKTDSPLIMRKPVPLLREKNLYFSQFQLFCGSEKPTFMNTTLNKVSANFSLSSFLEFDMSDPNFEFCLHINLTKYASRIRP